MITSDLARAINRLQENLINAGISGDCYNHITSKAQKILQPELKRDEVEITKMILSYLKVPKACVEEAAIPVTQARAQAREVSRRPTTANLLYNPKNYPEFLATCKDQYGLRVRIDDCILNMTADTDLKRARLEQCASKLTEAGKDASKYIESSCIESRAEERPGAVKISRDALDALYDRYFNKSLYTEYPKAEYKLNALSMLLCDYKDVGKKLEECSKELIKPTAAPGY